MKFQMLDGLLALARLSTAVAVDPAAQRMVLRVLMAAHAWQVERGHGVNRYDAIWNPTAVERELFEADCDLWAEVYTMNRMNHGRVSDEDGRRRCKARMTERLHHASDEAHGVVA